MKKRIWLGGLIAIVVGTIGFNPVIIPVLAPVNAAEIEKAGIIGRWRGFRDARFFRLYYYYEFRGDGTYSARHRAYRGENTVLDEFWSGRWTLDGAILNLEGTNDKNKDRTYQYRFQYKNDKLLHYTEGNLTKPYTPDTMGKL